MKIQRAWWYVIALVAIILVVMVVFKDSISLAPAQAKSSSSINLDLQRFSQQFSGKTDLTLKEKRDLSKVQNILLQTAGGRR